MTYPLPKWLQNRFAKLHRKFQTNPFSYPDAKNALKEKDDKTLSVILSALRKSGWICVTKSDQDSRKKEYCLKAPNTVFSEMKKENKMSKMVNKEA